MLDGCLFGWSNCLVTQKSQCGAKIKQHIGIYSYTQTAKLCESVSDKHNTGAQQSAQHCLFYIIRPPRYNVGGTE